METYGRQTSDHDTYDHDAVKLFCFCCIAVTYLFIMISIAMRLPEPFLLLRLMSVPAVLLSHIHFDPPTPFHIFSHLFTSFHILSHPDQKKQLMCCNVNWSLQ